MINRAVENWVIDRLFKGKAILIFGPRQCGKSTLVEKILQNQKMKFLFLNGDEADVRSILSDASSTTLKAILGKHNLVYIDEAQRIPNIGLTLKLFTDHFKSVQVIATGSSAFELSNKVDEPLTGRKYEVMLYPVSFAEMVNHHGLLQEKRLIEHRMVYGYYPEIVNRLGEEKEHLKLLANSYLYKDLLMFEQIKKPVLLEKLLKALALQVGSEVSYFELAQLIGADKGTVEKYIDLLEKAFVVFKLPALSRNVRNEIKKSKKIYFFDCGIRNAIIGNFQSVHSRTDVGALWENFVMAERMKFLRYNYMDNQMYFWRTTQQQEIDLVEELDGKFSAYEFKFRTPKNVRFSQTFTSSYETLVQQVYTLENMEGFLL